MSNPPLGLPSPPRQARRSHGAEDEEGTPTPIVACRRCRKQKLRCSRDLPSCKRCKDLSTVCEYPPPPDRKLLAAQRWQNAKARAHRESGNSQVPAAQDQKKLPLVGGKPEPQPLSQLPQIFNQDRNIAGAAALSDEDEEDDDSVSGHPYSSAPLQAALTRTTLPSAEVSKVLIDIYFSHLLNSSLVFHKKSFLEDYAANRVPDFLALSIFCLATIFLRKGSGKNKARQDLEEDGVHSGFSLLSSADLSEQGREWATAGTQRVLMQCDIPSIATIQACQNMALYWFAVGELERTDMHSFISFHAAAALRLNVGQNSGALTQEADSVTAEVQRRCYWSTWFVAAADKHSTATGSVWNEIAGLLFPSREDLFEEGNPVAHHSFDEKGNITSLTDEPIQLSLLGGLVTFFSLWIEIRRFVKTYADAKPEDFSKRIARLLELDSQIARGLELLHPDIRTANTNAFLSAKRGDSYRLFWVHGVYRICACTLHSSLVPLYSNNPPHPKVGKKLIRLSAEEVVKHASLTLDMATMFLATNPDVSQLPSTSGYAMFVAITLHFKSLVAQRRLHSPGALSRFKAALFILDHLKLYWFTVAALWSQLQTLFADSGLNIDAVLNIDLHHQASTEDQPQPSDIEKIVVSKESPPGAANTDFSNFAGSKETKSEARRRSSGHSQRKNPAHSTPSPNAITNEASSSSNASASGSRSRSQSAASHMNAPSQMYSSPPPRASMPFQTAYTNPSAPNQWQAYNENMQQYVYTHMPGGMSSEYMPLGTVAEDYEMQGHSGLGMQNMQAYANLDMMNMEMDVDQSNLWWDKSYVPFDPSMKPQQPDPNMQAQGQFNYGGRFAYG